MNLLENVFAAGERGNPDDETVSVSSYGSFPETGAIKTGEDVVKISGQLIDLGDKLDKKRRHQYAEWCYAANFIEDEGGPLEGWGAKLICIPFLLQFLWGPEKSPGYYTRSRWSWSDEEGKHVEEPSDWKRFSTEENYRDENASGCQLFFEFVRNLLVHGVDYMTNQKDAFAQFWETAGGRREPKPNKIRKQVLIWLDNAIGIEAILQKADAIRLSGTELRRALERAPDPGAAARFREILDDSAAPIRVRTFLATGLLLQLQKTTGRRPDEVAPKEQKGRLFLCDGPSRALMLLYFTALVALFEFLEEEALPPAVWDALPRTESGEGKFLTLREMATRFRAEVMATRRDCSGVRGVLVQQTGTGRSVGINPRDLKIFHGRICRLAVPMYWPHDRQMGQKMNICRWCAIYLDASSWLDHHYYNLISYSSKFKFVHPPGATPGNQGPLHLPKCTSHFQVEDI